MNILYGFLHALHIDFQNRNGISPDGLIQSIMNNNKVVRTQASKVSQCGQRDASQLLAGRSTHREIVKNDSSIGLQSHTKKRCTWGYTGKLVSHLAHIALCLDHLHLVGRLRYKLTGRSFIHGHTDADGLRRM